MCSPLTVKLPSRRAPRHHYKCADVNRYAQMMKAHREMVLDGYDVYRIGGKELYVGSDGNEEPAKQVVFEFLEGLFKKYRVMP